MENDEGWTYVYDQQLIKNGPLCALGVLSLRSLPCAFCISPADMGELLNQ
jgi:hypothetical protein